MRFVVLTPSFQQMLAEMRGMNEADAFRFVQRNVFSWRFSVVDTLRLRSRGARFAAEETFVRAILGCTSAQAMNRLMADYRAQSVRIRGLSALMLGTWRVRSMAVYFLGLEQRWRFKNKV